MPTIGESGVSFDFVAREWRCKYAFDAEGTPAKSTALKAANDLLTEYLPTLKAMDGAEVSRVVCGGCADFKVITKLPADKYGGWEGSEFPPEKEFIEKLKAIEGIIAVETQTYTLQVM